MLESISDSPAVKSEVDALLVVSATATAPSWSKCLRDPVMTERAPPRPC
jgi:hypothetical protein